MCLYYLLGGIAIALMVASAWTPWPYTALCFFAALFFGLAADLVYEKEKK